MPPERGSARAFRMEYANADMAKGPEHEMRYREVSRPFRHWDTASGSEGAEQTPDPARALRDDLAAALSAARLPSSDTFIAKAQLAAGIADVIREQRLTQAQAGYCLRLTQPRVSELLAGKLESLSLERLMRCMTALGSSVRIVVGPPSPGSRPAMLFVDALYSPAAGSAATECSTTEFVLRVAERIVDMDFEPTQGPLAVSSVPWDL